MGKMTVSAGISESFVAMRNRLARAISHIVPPKDIEDIVQETYVRACNFERENVIKHPPSFLLKTAKNLALNHVKSANYRLTETADDMDDDSFGLAERDRSVTGDQTLTSALAHEEFSYFCEAVRHLPAQCRRVFILKKVYGYSQKEIAGSLKISASAVEKHIAEGMKRCTYFMMRHYDIDKMGVSPANLTPGNKGVKDFGRLT